MKCKKLYGMLQRLFPILSSVSKAQQLEMDLAEKEQTCHLLKIALDKVQADCRGLQKNGYDRRDLIAALLERPTAELRKDLRYEVRPALSKGEWEVVTQRCCLGGCDMGLYVFATERDALLFASLLGSFGYEPQKNVACPDCYAEYSRNLI